MIDTVLGLIKKLTRVILDKRQRRRAWTLPTGGSASVGADATTLASHATSYVLGDYTVLITAANNTVDRWLKRVTMGNVTATTDIYAVVVSTGEDSVEVVRFRGERYMTTAALQQEFFLERPVFIPAGVAISVATTSSSAGADSIDVKIAGWYNLGE